MHRVTQYEFIIALLDNNIQIEKWRKIKYL